MRLLTFLNPRRRVASAPCRSESCRSDSLHSRNSACKKMCGYVWGVALSPVGLSAVLAAGLTAAGLDLEDPPSGPPLAD